MKDKIIYGLQIIGAVIFALMALIGIWLVSHIIHGIFMNGGDFGYFPLWWTAINCVVASVLLYCVTVVIQKMALKTLENVLKELSDLKYALRTKLGSM